MTLLVSSDQIFSLTPRVSLDRGFVGDSTGFIGIESFVAGSAGRKGLSFGGLSATISGGISSSGGAAGRIVESGTGATPGSVLGIKFGLFRRLSSPSLDFAAQVRLFLSRETAILSC